MKIVEPLDAGDDVERERHRRALPHGIVLPEELDRLAARAVNPGLQPAHHTEPVLESDQRAAVEAEELAGELAETRPLSVPREPVRDAERAFVARQPQRCWQVDGREIGLDEAGPAIGNIARIDNRRRRRGFLLLCPGYDGQKEQHRSGRHANRAYACRPPPQPSAQSTSADSAIE